MTPDAPGTSDISASPPLRIEGEALLRELRSGSFKLPSRTLLALVMGGLRVRMMRSIVTMGSIILAIAFLTYTGVSNRLAFNVASAARALEEAREADPAAVAAAVTAVAEARFVTELPTDRQRRLALALGMSDLVRLEAQLPDAALAVRRNADEMQKTQADLAKIQNDPAAVADVAMLRARVQDLEKAQAAAERDLAELEARLRLAQWVRSGRLPAGEDQASMVQRLGAAVQHRSSSLLAQLRTPGRLSPDELRQVELLVDHAAAAASADATTTEALRQALAQEQTKRAAADLRTLLRRAGVSVEATLRGNPLDRWLILMALLTCAVGIANAMLMSVTERFREIGTMKCLGALDSLVVKLFLLESAFLGVVGAVLGIVLGFAVGVLAAVLQYGRYGVSYFPGTDSLVVVLLSLLGGVILSVVGATYPAFAASRMRPVDALRVDE